MYNLKRGIKSTALTMSIGLAFFTPCITVLAQEAISDEELRTVTVNGTADRLHHILSVTKNTDKSDKEQSTQVQAGYSDSTAAQIIDQFSLYSFLNEVLTQQLSSLSVTDGSVILDNQEKARYQFAIISLLDIGSEPYSTRWADNYNELVDLDISSRDSLNYKQRTQEFYQVNSNTYDATTTIYGNDIEVVGIHGMPTFDVEYHDSNGRSYKSAFANGLNTFFTNNNGLPLR